MTTDQRPRRTILHADLDAFYASVEQLDNPALRDRPVVVGGPPESRGVVAAASYEARKFGVRSAMPMSRAMRLCPDCVRVPPRFKRYGAMSKVVMGIFRAVTPLIEPLSLDEAFLDISANAQDAGDAERIGSQLKRQVRLATGLTLSVGGGANKTVAKIASDFRKPDGLLIVPHGQERAFLAPLPVRALWGVGPKTQQALRHAGVRTIGDLAERSAGDALRLLGSRGEFLLDMARGIDDRAVETTWERKSVGAETTFARDLADGPELRDELQRIAEEVAVRMLRIGVSAHTVSIKLRYARFKTITRQASSAQPIDSARQIGEIAARLLDEVAEPADQFRLLGIQCSKLEGGSAASMQRSLWEEEGEPDAQEFRQTAKEPR